MLPVKTGVFRGIVVVPEGSARDGVNFNLDSSADHFSVCRPETKTSRRFNALTTLSSVCDNSKEERAVFERQAIRQNREFLPKQLVNMDVLVQEVKSRLQKFPTLGLVGMGGLGKTTLARAVFNELSPAYEYSCFVPDLEVKGRAVEEVKKVVWKHMHRLGRKVKAGVEDDENWSTLNDKQLLLVLDNISDDLDITVLSHLVDGPSPQSRFIVTSRDGDILKRVDDVDIFKVPFLNQKDSEKLFLSHAFPQPANLPANLKRDMVAIVEKCSGLPLTLEVLGKHLKFEQDRKFWQQTLQAVINADNIRDLDKRLWAKLRVSYDGLDEVEQQMFLDATTFFQGYFWCLRDAKAAWRKAYETQYETIQWQTLVDRSLVYHVEENESIKTHDQLLSLGRKIASEPSNSGRCRVWDRRIALKLLQNDEELANQDIHDLRLSNHWDASTSDASSSEDIHIPSHTLKKLKKLLYLEMDGPLFIDGVEEERSLPSKLVLLKCSGRLDTFNFVLQGSLVVLQLHGVEVLPRSIGQLSALRIFISTSLHCVPDEFGNLSQLEHLVLYDCDLKSLPETFCKLSQLQYLKFMYCHRLHILPEKFGALSKLKDLEFHWCFELRSLPDTFGDLSALDRLVFKFCPSLNFLSTSFGTLAALTHLEIHRCHELQVLSDSFGHLSALKHLEITDCNKLQALPHSFGHLSALKHLEIRSFCDLRVPDSFGHLEGLEDLKLQGCQLEAVVNSFGKLSSLRHLELTNCRSNILSVIPFGELTQLLNLEIIGERTLIPIKMLPESLAELTALTSLVLRGLSIRSIPDFMKSMQSLHTLELSVLPYVQELPAWLGDAGVAPLATSQKIFKVQDKRFSLAHEDNIILLEALMIFMHENAMEKVSEHDYQGALEYICCANLAMLKPRWHKLLLQASGIMRCHMGDLQGALEDLTAALEVSSDDAESREYRSLYECWSYRGYVNFLLGDLGRANDDGANALRLLRTDRANGPIWWLPFGFGKETVTYMDFRLAGKTERNEHSTNLCSAHCEMMDKVRISDFQGALAIWCDFDVTVYSQCSRVYSLQERGILKRIVGDLHGALEDLTTAFEIDDDNYKLLKHRGYVKYLMGDKSGAREDAERCMAMDPVERGMYDCLGGLSVAFMEFRLKGSEGVEGHLWSSSHEKVMEKVEEKEFLGALAIWDDFDARVGGYYHRVFFLKERGLLKRMAGDLDGALEDLTAALETDDNNYELLKHRGYVKYLMGDKSGAQRDAERCMAMEPKVDGQNCLGGLPVAYLEFRLKGRQHSVGNLFRLSHGRVMDKVEEKEFLGALKIWDEFDASVCGCHDSRFFLKERGILKRMAGDIQGALEDLTAALEIDDDEYDLLKHRGYVKYLMGDDSGARQDAERCMAMDPVVQLPLAFFRLEEREHWVESLFTSSHKKIKEKVKEKEFLGALAVWDDFDASVCGYNDRVFFLQVSGILQRMAGNLQGALEDLTRALEISADDYECLKHRGYVKFLLGDIDGAQKDAERCLALGLKKADSREDYYYLVEFPVAFLEFEL